MKPLDPRLLRYAASARKVLGLGAVLGVLRTAAILAWCWLLGQAIAAAVLPVLGGMGGAAGMVADNAALPQQVPWLLAGAAAAMCIRSACAWGMDVLAARGAVQVKSELRSAALDSLDTQSPQGDARPSDSEFTTVLGRGLDALDGYFSGYLPQLILTAVSTPVLIIAVLLADPVSGVIVLIVFPIIPVFMVLIGLATQAVQDRQWAQLQRLSSSFLDAIEGLSTLKIFGREHRQSARIVRETEQYRSRTMKVLRVTFLSGFVLDLAGTFSIALVAVTVGTRLVNGDFPLALGLFVLLLLPEVFIPIRQVGAAFHTSTEGLTASQRVFEIIEGGADGVMSDRGAPSSEAPVSGVRSTDIVFDAVTVERGGREVVGPVSFEVRPGEVVGLAGPSGAGKSTLLATLLGFAEPSSGRATAPSVSWVGQRPGLLQGTVAENVTLGAETDAIDAALVRRALDTVGLQHTAADQPLGALGTGLSGGQAQRVAIARALYRAWSREPGALLLDEPTSALDSANEALVCDAMRAEASRGAAVLVVSHRPAVLAAADRVVRIGEAVLSEAAPDKTVLGDTDVAPAPAVQETPEVNS